MAIPGASLVVSTLPFFRMAWRSTQALGGVARQPAWLATPLESALVKAMPLALVAGAAIGVVIWIHVRDALVRTIDEAHAVVDTMQKRNRVMTVGVPQTKRHLARKRLMRTWFREGIALENSMMPAKSLA